MVHKKSIATLLFLWVFLGTSVLLSESIRIMPLGDSITEGVTEVDGERILLPQNKRAGYRVYLWEKLRKANYVADFVGSIRSGDSIKTKFDTQHEGHPGWTSHNIAQRAYEYMNDSKPNVVLLHIGTNDYSRSTSGIESILNEIDHYEKSTGNTVRVIIAMIIDRKRDDLIIPSFNHNLQKLVISRWENGDILTLINMYKDAKLTKSDYTNNTHPNNNGYQKMANVWFEAITTPYVEFTSAPTAKDDNISAETGITVTINVLLNDKDRQNDMNISSVSFVGGTDTGKKKLFVKNEGTWTVDKNGIVTFKPKKGFTANPTPAQYTVKDNEGEVSKPAKIFINYNNTSLTMFPYTLVNESNIEATSINRSSNSIEIIARVPHAGITF